MQNQVGYGTESDSLLQLLMTPDGRTIIIKLNHRPA